jgi:hypothetical protein
MSNDITDRFPADGPRDTAPILEATEFRSLVGIAITFHVVYGNDSGAQQPYARTQMVASAFACSARASTLHLLAFGAPSDPAASPLF